MSAKKDNKAAPGNQAEVKTKPETEVTVKKQAAGKVLVHQGKECKPGDKITIAASKVEKLKAKGFIA